ncbi:DUF1641 domain-containing protein [Thermoproteus tenax]|uniref:DUF1641 domain-containing protein n=1 Tax=Thermoproteus tenax (strain ATCC 35583 / DSM 2078 / JCM 9277 / NBRC 100435 / Kra 1) TaxID=768679 RepID=G4RNE6_THETK|nr:DUF1641 domain-containing protein [Thermoproteus tenax]CCC81090.1 conserved hypothetical protein [Thermoproteus tenax Kra 1]
MSSEKLDKLIELLQQEKTQQALLEIVEKIDVVKDLVDALFEFKRSGILDDLLQAVAALRFITEGLLTKDFMERISKLQEVALIAGTNLSADSSKVDCITNAIATADGSKPIGLWGLLNALGDPEIQRGLGYLMSVLKKIGSCPHIT